MQREPRGVAGDAQNRFDEMNEAKTRWREHCAAPATSADDSSDALGKSGRPHRAPRARRARSSGQDER
jgi:hypothetical protein